MTSTFDLSWPDEPIRDLEADRLDRGRFVKMVAASINSCGIGQASTVFGLAGAWGSGKSSLIELITNQLDPGWKVAVFSPWAMPNSAGIAPEFLSALSAAVDAKSNAALKAVRRYAKLGTPFLAAVPVVGFALGKSADVFVDRFTGGQPWHVEFQRLADELARMDRRVLIVADDIDRLDADELLEFLKVVRLLGRFPNVHYLIAYDQGTVDQLLASKGIEGKTSSFMEKIVQYPFELPPISSANKHRELANVFTSILTAHGLELDDANSERASELLGVLAPALDTPRAQARFANQLSIYARMIDLGEVDPVDFFALTYIRVACHRLYEEMPEWAAALRSGDRRTSSTTTEKITTAEWTELIAAVTGPRMAGVYQQLLAFLFPGVETNSFVSHRPHPKALFDPQYFERYFIFGVAPDDVSDRLVARALEELVAGDVESESVGQLTEVFVSPDTSKAAVGYQKARQYRQAATKASPPVLEYLGNRLDALPDSPDWSFKSAEQGLWGWVQSEYFLALSDGTVDMHFLINRFGIEVAVGVLRRIRNSRQHDHTEVSDMFDSAATQMLEGFEPTWLSSQDTMFATLYIFEKSARLEDLESVIENYLGRDVELLVAFTQLFSAPSGWSDEGEESWRFDGERYKRVMPSDLASELLQQLPPTPVVDELVPQNLSGEQLREFSIACARQVLSRS
jgi:hypothetical protein